VSRESIKGELMADEVVDGQAADGQAVNAQAVNAQAADGEVADGEAATDAGCEAIDASPEAAIVDTDFSAGRSGDAKNSPLFNRIPLDVYLDWLQANVARAGHKAALKTAALEVPVELPSEWLRYGLDAAKWSDAVEIIAPRFRWLAEVAASMRRDCRRFVADETPSIR
jgi:hypothetical protein